MNLLKADIINDAMSQLTINGITTDPTPDENQQALVRLESMAAEWESRNICTNYNFTQEPDINDDANISLAFMQAYATNLAVRLIPDFNKEVPQMLYMQAQQSLSNLANITFPIRPTAYPRRQARGSGNTQRQYRWSRFYPQSVRTPPNCETKRMTEGGINDYFEPFQSYLNVDETIKSFSFKTLQGLVIEGDIDDQRIDYTVQADQYGEYAVVLSITTSEGRKTNRELYFSVVQLNAYPRN